MRIISILVPKNGTRKSYNPFMNLLIIATAFLGTFMVALHAIDFKEAPCVPDGAGLSTKESKLISGHTLRIETDWFEGAKCEGEPIRRTTYNYRILENDETHMAVELASVRVTLMSER